MDSRHFVAQLDRPEDVGQLIRCQTLPTNLELVPLRLERNAQPKGGLKSPPERLKLCTEFDLECAVRNSKLPRFSPQRFGCNIVRLERQRQQTLSRSWSGADLGGSAAALAQVAGA